MTVLSRKALASPTVFLVSITFINWLGFASWQALLNNFAKDAANFTGWEIGVLFGRIWIEDPSPVFGIGAGIAAASLTLAFLVPRHPEPGAKTVLGQPGRVVPAE